jgi:hypothetical protein
VIVDVSEEHWASTYTKDEVTTFSMFIRTLCTLKTEAVISFETTVATNNTTQIQPRQHETSSLQENLRPQAYNLFLSLSTTIHSVLFIFKQDLKKM